MYVFTHSQTSAKENIFIQHTVIFVYITLLRRALTFYCSKRPTYFPSSPHRSNVRKGSDFPKKSIFSIFLPHKCNSISSCVTRGKKGKKLTSVILVPRDLVPLFYPSRKELWVRSVQILNALHWTVPNEKDTILNWLFNFTFGLRAYMTTATSVVV